MYVKALAKNLNNHFLKDWWMNERVLMKSRFEPTVSEINSGRYFALCW
jgi:hypothetical protein